MLNNEKSQKIVSLITTAVLIAFSLFLIFDINTKNNEIAALEQMSAKVDAKSLENDQKQLQNQQEILSQLKKISEATCNK